MKKKDQKARCGSDVNPIEENQGTALPELSAEESATVDKYLERTKSEPPHFEAKMVDGICRVNYGSLSDRQLLLQAAKLAEATGTGNRDLSNGLLAQAPGTYFQSYDATAISRNLNNAAALLYGIKPQDELEAMLAVQMVGAHNLAMEFFRRAMLKEQTQDGATEAVNRATKLMRTFGAQMEALTKWRAKGEQKVTVEHVHVNAGGQAIVGVVEQQPGGGGHGRN